MRRRRTPHTRESLLRAMRPRRGEKTWDQAVRDGDPIVPELERAIAESPAMKFSAELDRWAVEHEQRMREMDEWAANRWLHALGRVFEHTRNALFAWEAWRVSRESRVPLPEWAAVVLDGWAAALDRITSGPTDPRATDDLPEILGLAGAFEGDTSTFTKYRDAHRNLRLAWAVIALLDDSRRSPDRPTPRSVTAAVRMVAEREKRSPSTVRRALKWWVASDIGV